MTTEVCNICNSAFNPKHSNQKCCSSDQCQGEKRLRDQRLYRDRKRDYFRNYWNVRRKRLFPRKEKVCLGCGKSYLSSHDFIKCCSVECRRKWTTRRTFKNQQKPHQKAWRKGYLKRLRKENHEYRLRVNISRAVNLAIRRNNGGKRMSILKALPYSIPQLKAHLEAQFNNQNSFTWENHGKKWHIDHIVPQSLFKITDVDSKAFRDCWALSNLRPLCSILNVRKRNRHVIIPETL